MVGFQNFVIFWFGLDLWKGKEIPKIHLLLLIDYDKVFDCVDYNKVLNIFKEMGITDHLTCLLRSLIQVKKQELEPDMEQ